MSTFKTSRTFAASPAAVFAAFAAPDRLARWWGPDGFRNTIEVFEFEPGGRWRLTMHGPDGSDHPNEATFLAIEPARAVVIRHTSEPRFQLTIGLEAIASGTLVTWEQAFDSPEVAAAVRHIVEPANEQNLSRWQAEVADGLSRTASR
jgi:uncharacterized protein YndB with AHSA1/START domain